MIRGNVGRFGAIRILIFGGLFAAGLLAANAAAPAFAQTSGAWAKTGSMNSARAGHFSVLLNTGRVLAAGGAGPTTSSSFSPLTSAELFDPSQGQWSFTGSMSGPGTSPGSLLANGDVLVSRRAFCDSATGTWTDTGTFPTGLGLGTTAALLGMGKVLLTGFTQTCKGCRGAPTTVALLYDFLTNTYRSTGSMNAPRIGDSAVLLPSGQVLVSGGEDNRAIFHTLTSAELYTPS